MARRGIAPEVRLVRIARVVLRLRRQSDHAVRTPDVEEFLLPLRCAKEYWTCRLCFAWKWVTNRSFRALCSSTRERCEKEKPSARFSARKRSWSWS